jgi:hypothetical protein
MQNAGEWGRLKNPNVAEELIHVTLSEEAAMRDEESSFPLAEHLNHSRDPESLLKAYKEGVLSGIHQAIADMRSKG